MMRISGFARSAAPDRVLSFSRKFETEELIVVINMSSSPFRGTIEASGRFEDITPDYRDSKRDRGTGLPFVNLGAWEFRVFRRFAL